MKKTAFVILTTLLVAASIDILQQLKIDSAQAKNFVFESVIYNRLSYPATCSKLEESIRIEAIKFLLPFAKDYTRTTDFNQRYETWWKDSEPLKPLTLEERKAKRISDEQKNNNDINKTVEDMKKQIAETKDTEMKKTLEEALQTYNETMKTMNSSEMQKNLEQSKTALEQQDKTEFEEETKRYNDEMVVWQQKKNPDAMLKKALSKYLELVQTVDFSAATETGNFGKKVFTNNEYESKPAEWKMIYRAGKEVNGFAKTFAKEWIKELK